MTFPFLSGKKAGNPALSQTLQSPTLAMGRAPVGERLGRVPALHLFLTTSHVPKV